MYNFIPYLCNNLWKLSKIFGISYLLPFSTESHEGTRDVWVDARRT